MMYVHTHTLKHTHHYLQRAHTLTRTHTHTHHHYPQRAQGSDAEIGEDSQPPTFLDELLGDGVEG